MLRGRPLAGLSLAGVVFAAAYLGGRSLDASRSERIADHAIREAQESARLAREAIAVQLESVKMTVHNAVVNPRLVVVLRGRVDAATLKDALSSESWWEPFREVITAISYEGEQVVFQQGDAVWQGLPLVELIRSVRATGARAVQLGASQGRVFALAATAMPAGEAEPPVVVMAKPIDAPVLTAMGAGNQTPVLLSNGRRSLGGWGPARDVRLLEATVGREAEGAMALQDTAWGAAARELTPGLWLWAGSRVTDFAAAQMLELEHWKRLIWGGTSALALIFVIVSLLPRRRPWDEPRSLDAERAAGLVPLTPAPVPSPRPTAPEAPPPGTGIGTPLGRYVLLDRIGEGGMAEVFTAVSFGSGGFRRTFVVKRLRPEMASNPVAVAHFIDEANLASTLVHTNIVPVFDFGEVAGSYFLAQEYVVGRDLGRLGRRMLEQNLPRLSVSAALFVVHQMLLGLHHAHEKRGDDGTPLELVHRDVTPENVMISERGDVKLLDFGIVKSIQRVSQTDIGTVKGNVDYMSPEQARGRVVDRRSDIFSAGLVLYFALMRTPLYQGDTLYDRLMRAALGPGEEDCNRIDALPAPLPEVLRKALAIEAENRFQTAAEFAQALAPYIEGGQAEVAGVLGLLFGDELQLEQDRLAAAFPRGRRREDAVAEESKS